ncbi:hypothetical protein DHEL01_v212085 [Diaporthe helianthi]|uniref:Uncharacterized protein n=1 Tax=Diaporthe helianthi TaxID=158607 RepID=A0A2P5HGZ7_DIAHE|nr:hypothetical protein DHEL01_v212085 [Diaporthe helianthi]
MQNGADNVGYDDDDDDGVRAECVGAVAETATMNQERTGRKAACGNDALFKPQPPAPDWDSAPVTHFQIPIARTDAKGTYGIMPVLWNGVGGGVADDFRLSCPGVDSVVGSSVAVH